MLHHLAPAYWFAAHLHVKFAALVSHDELHHAATTTSDAGGRNPDEGVLGDVLNAGNPDEIDLGMDDSDDEEPAVQQDTKPMMNADEIDLGMDDSDDEEPSTQQETTTESVPVNQEVPTTTEPIESIDQVASIPDAEFAKEAVHDFAGTAKEEVEQVNGAIMAEDAADGRGLETRFLALDKCGFGRDFIQVSVTCDFRSHG